MRTILVSALLTVLSLTESIALAGTWSQPTKVTSIGAWAIWFGFTVEDTGAAWGCSGSGTKALDISTTSPVKNAQQTLLTTAFATGKRVQVYYDSCKDGTSVVTNVQIVN